VLAEDVRVDDHLAADVGQHQQTHVRVPGAYPLTLARASLTRKYAVISTSSGQRWADTANRTGRAARSARFSTAAMRPWPRRTVG
jgi:hypothetical protein